MDHLTCSLPLLPPTYFLLHTVANIYLSANKTTSDEEWSTILFAIICAGQTEVKSKEANTDHVLHESYTVAKLSKLQIRIYVCPNN